MAVSIMSRNCDSFKGSGLSKVIEALESVEEGLSCPWGLERSTRTEESVSGLSGREGVVNMEPESDCLSKDFDRVDEISEETGSRGYKGTGAVRMDESTRSMVDTRDSSDDTGVIDMMLFFLAESKGEEDVDMGEADRFLLSCGGRASSVPSFCARVTFVSSFLSLFSELG